MKRGDIYLAYLNPKKGAEVGKIRPVLIIQTDILNKINHPTIIVLPLSTQLIDEAYPLRYRIKKRDKLNKDSDILCDQIRAISIDRLKEKLTTIKTSELQQIEEQLKLILFS